MIMKDFLKMNLVRRFLLVFLVIIIPILAFSLLVNYMSVSVAREELNKAYNNSNHLLASQLDDSLKKFELISKGLVMDSKLDYWNYLPKISTEAIYGYIDLLKQLRLFSNTNEIDSLSLIYIESYVEFIC